MFQPFFRTLAWLSFASLAFGAGSHLPVYFEPNVGQIDAEAQFVARTPAASVFLSRGDAILAQADSHVRMRLTGARAFQRPEPLEMLPGYTNYFVGNDAGNWRTRVAHYAKIRYRDVYPGVDLIYYSTGRSVEYDFIVSPGADPSKIRIAYEGADRLRLDRQGDVIITANGRALRQRRPHVYQTIDGERREIRADYRINSGIVAFALASFDRTKPLVIDPVIELSMRFGAGNYDYGVSVAADAQRNIYVAGVTNSLRFPATQPAQEQNGGATDAVIAKFSPSGDLVYVTYLGGRGTESCNSIAVDNSGTAFVTGDTTSSNFPVRGGVQGTFGGGADDVYVTRISANGDALIYSTYLGGGADDFGNGLAVDADGAAYLSGWTRSSDFPTRNPIQSSPSGGGADTFLTKLAPSGGSIVYSTFVGAEGQDIGAGVAVDSNKNAYVTGQTTSRLFPTKSPVQSANGGGFDAFLYKVNPEGNSLVYSTYLGGALDEMGYRIAIDNAGSAYVMGYTKSANFPTRGAAQPNFGGNTDVFVAKLAPNGGALQYSTFLGGSGEDWGFGNIAIDAAGSAYVAGYTKSTDFPVRNASQPAFAGGEYDGFVTRVAPGGGSLLYSTYIGGEKSDRAFGIALDRNNAVVVIGGTNSTNFLNARNILPDITQDVSDDIFIVRLAADASATLLSANPQTLAFSGSGSQTVALTSSGAPLTLAAGSTVPWISVQASGNSTPATLTITVNTQGLAGGALEGAITINSPQAANTPLTIPVTLSTPVVPVIASLVPSSVEAGADVMVTVTGSGFSPSSSVLVNGANVPAMYLNATALRAQVPSGLTAKPGVLQIAVSSLGATSAAFALNVVSAGPSLTAAGVVNGATFQSGAVAPGQIITVFGSGFGPDARVLFNGIAGPVLYVFSEQIGAVVPYALAALTSATVEVEVAGRRSIAVGVVVAPASPGIFTVESRGTGQAAAANENGSPNSSANPSEKGSIVTFYATGEGVVTPPVSDGVVVSSTNLPRPVLPVNVTLGEQDAEILYAGSAPGQIAGVMQVNARVPQNAGSGAQPVVLRIGSVSSPGGVTIAVR